MGGGQGGTALGPHRAPPARSQAVTPPKGPGRPPSWLATLRGARLVSWAASRRAGGRSALPVNCLACATAGGPRPACPGPGLERGVLFVTASRGRAWRREMQTAVSPLTHPGRAGSEGADEAGPWRPAEPGPPRRETGEAGCPFQAAGLPGWDPGPAIRPTGHWRVAVARPTKQGPSVPSRIKGRTGTRGWLLSRRPTAHVAASPSRPSPERPATKGASCEGITRAALARPGCRDLPRALGGGPADCRPVSVREAAHGKNPAIPGPVPGSLADPDGRLGWLARDEAPLNSASSTGPT